MSREPLTYEQVWGEPEPVGAEDPCGKGEMMKLNSENVETVFLDCLFTNEEDRNNCIKAEGLLSTVGFHAERLESHREDIKNMLAMLPEEFHADSGGGGSFLNAGNDKKGMRWTGFHQRKEQLFQLAIGLGMAKYCVPRELWSMLPGGMPNIVLVEAKMDDVPVQMNKIANRKFVP